MPHLVEFLRLEQHDHAFALKCLVQSLGKAATSPHEASTSEEWAFSSMMAALYSPTWERPGKRQVQQAEWFGDDFLPAGFGVELLNGFACLTGLGSFGLPPCFLCGLLFDVVGPKLAHWPVSIPGISKEMHWNPMRIQSCTC